MKRLPSAKAKKILEFFAKKQLDAANVEMKFIPYFYERNMNDIPKNVLCQIEVNVTYHDGKGYNGPLLVERRFHTTFNVSYMKQHGTSFARLARCIERRIAKNDVFGIHGYAIFDKSFIIEKASVGLDLENHDVEQKRN